MLYSAQVESEGQKSGDTATYTCLPGHIPILETPDPEGRIILTCSSDGWWRPYMHPGCQSKSTCLCEISSLQFTKSDKEEKDINFSFSP